MRGTLRKAIVGLASCAALVTTGSTCCPTLFWKTVLQSGSPGMGQLKPTRLYGAQKWQLGSHLSKGTW